MNKDVQDLTQEDLERMNADEKKGAKIDLITWIRESKQILKNYKSAHFFKEEKTQHESDTSIGQEETQKKAGN